MDFSVIFEGPSQSIQVSKMITIILAENGTLNQYPSSKFISSISIKKASFLMDFIEKEFGINKSNQVIIRADDGKHLDNSIDLEEFFQKDQTVYVFSTKGQRQGDAQEEFEVISPIALEKKWSESCMQFLPSIYENYLGSNMRDYLESQILGSYDNLLILFSDIKNELNSLRAGSTKVKRQKDAELVAKKSLLNYNGHKKKKVDNVLALKEAKLKTFEQSIKEFDVHIKKLSKQEVDPQLAQDNIKYLIDYFDINKLNKNKEIYEKNQEKIRQKAEEIKEEVSDYGLQLKDIEEIVLDNSSEIETLLQEQENLFASAQDTNLQEFRNMIEEKKENPSQDDLSNFVKRESETTIPKLRQIQENLKSIKEKLESNIKENVIKLRKLISDMLSLRVVIKGKIYNRLKVFCALVDKHEEGIRDIEIVEKFPQIYKQAINEIKRRCNFKKDFLTMLGILESLANSENKLRYEFLEKNQHYLPKAFCPFLSRSFTEVKYHNIRKKVDEDLSVSFNECIQSFAKPSAEGDILKLLKNLNDNLESKDNRNKKLEGTLQSLKEENEALRKQLQEKSLNTNNLRKLLGDTGFEETIDELIKKCRSDLTDKIMAIKERVETVQNNKISSFEKIFKSIREESMLKSLKLDEYEKLIEEHEKNLSHLTSSIKEKEKFIDEMAQTCSQIQGKLEKSRKENETLLKEKDLKEKEVKRLSDQIKNYEEKEKELKKTIEKYEKKEKDSQKTKDKQLESLTKEFDLLEKEVSTKERAIEELENKISELSHKNESLEAQLRQALESSEAGNVKLAELYNSLREIQKENELIQNTLKMKNEDLSQKEEELRSKSKELEDIKLRNIDIEKSLNTLQAERGLTQQNLEVIKQSLGKKEVELADNISKFEALIKEFNSLKKERQQLKEALMSKAESLKSNEEINAELNAKLLNREKEMEKLKDLLNKFQTKGNILESSLKNKDLKIQELSNKLEQESLEKSLALENNMPLVDEMSEIGTCIIETYGLVFGHQKLLSEELDVVKQAHEIRKYILTKMIKIDDFKLSDKVAAVKLPNFKYYVILRTDFTNDKEEIKILYLYEGEHKSNVIIGEILWIDDLRETEITGEKKELAQFVGLNILNPLPYFS